MSTNNYQNFHLGVKAVITNSEGEILLLRLNPNSMAKPNEHYWDFPGGRVLENEDIDECLKRTVQSETGISPKVIENLGLVISGVQVNSSGDNPINLILQTFLCNSENGQNIKLSNKFCEFGWFVPKVASELLKEKYPPHFAYKFVSPHKIESHSGQIIQVVLEQVSFKKGDQQITKTFEQARRSPGTRLIVTSENKILLTKEFRKELNTYDYRLPGGKVFDKLEEYLNFEKSQKDITPIVIEAGKKEAREELGIDPTAVSVYYKSVAGSTIEWDLYYLVVTKFNSLPSQNLETGEDIQTNWFTFQEAKELALSGQMSEDRSMAVLLRYLHSKNVS